MMDESVGSLVYRYVTRSALQDRRRALAKTVGYRLLMVVITVVVAYAVVGDVAQALNVGIAANVLKTGTYYAYERLWDRIDWGVSLDAAGG